MFVINLSDFYFTLILIPDYYYDNLDYFKHYKNL